MRIGVVALFALFLSVISTYIFAKSPVYLRVLENQLSEHPSNEVDSKTNFVASVYFGEKLEIIDKKGEMVKVRSLDSGREGWTSRYLITEYPKQITFLEKAELIPNSTILINAPEKAQFTLKVLSGSLHVSEDKKGIPVEGLVLMFKDGPWLKTFSREIFGSKFTNPNPEALYIYNGKTFIELAPDPKNGFAKAAEFPLYRPPELNPTVSEVEGKFSLQYAISKGMISTQFAGRGASSGDAIIVEVQNKTSRPVAVYVIPGTVLKSRDSSAQNMILQTVKGKIVGERGYLPKDFIELQPGSSSEYLIEAYCLNFDKDNPSSETSFELGEVEIEIQNILYQGKVWGMPPSVIQAAVWIFHENIEDYKLKEKFEINDAEIKKAKELVTLAGKPLSNNASTRKGGNGK